MLAAYGIPYRVVIKDFRGKERVVFGEVPVVEDEQELHSVLQSLDGVRHAPRKVSSDCKATESFLKNKEGGGGGFGIRYLRREEPDVALAHVVDECLTVLVDSLTILGQRELYKLDGRRRHA